MFVPRRELKARFEEENASIMGQGILLDFAGAEGYDVYNCCAPFTANGREYIKLFAIASILGSMLSHQKKCCLLQLLKANLTLLIKRNPHTPIKKYPKKM